MSSDDFKAKCARTREIFLEGGVDISEWAVSRGFTPEAVNSLLEGRSSGLRGMSRLIAESLGLVYPRPKAKSAKYAKRSAARAELRNSQVKTSLEVSWRRVGDAIDRLAAQGLTPAQWAEGIGLSWLAIKPVFVDLQTPKYGGGMRACQMLELLGPPEMKQHLYPRRRSKLNVTKKAKKVRTKPVREARLEVSQLRMKELLERLKNERVRLGEFVRLHRLDGPALFQIVKSRVKGASGRPKAVAEALDLLGTFTPTHDHPPAPAWHRRAQINALRPARRGKPLPTPPSTQIAWEALDAMRMKLSAQGITARAWAEKNNFPLTAVESVLNGLDRGEVGITQAAAHRMGIGFEHYVQQHLYPKNPRRRVQHPVQVSIKRLDMMRALMADSGVTPGVWAERFGFEPEVVESVLKGEDQCVQGQARQVAAKMYILGDAYIEQHIYPRPPLQPKVKKVKAKPPKDPSPQWAYKLKEWLASDAAPEVIHQQDLIKVCFEIRQQLPGAPVMGVRFAERWIRQMIAEKALKRWQSHLVNKMVSRHPVGFDMARRLKPGAVISLWTVLIRNDLLANAVRYDIACVVAPRMGQEQHPQVEIIIPKLPPFTFYEVDHLSDSSKVVLPADSLDDRFSCPVATSERAFLEWLALIKRRGPGWVPAAPSTIKYEAFDLDQLHHLANLMGLRRDLDLWLAWRKSMTTRPPQPVVRPLGARLKATEEPMGKQTSPKLVRATPEPAPNSLSSPAFKRRGRPPKVAPSFESLLFSQMRSPVIDAWPEAQPDTIRVRRSRDVAPALHNGEMETPPPAKNVSWKRVGDAIDKMAAKSTTPRRWASVNGYPWWLIRPVFEEAVLPGSAAARKVAKALDLIGSLEMEQHVYPRPLVPSDVSPDWQWPAAMQRWIESESAPESLTREEIFEAAWSTCHDVDGGRSPDDPTIVNWIHQNVEQGVLMRIDRVYVNTRARTVTNGFGIAHSLYPGSIVSLWTVLRQEGLIEGSSEDIASVGAPLRTRIKSERLEIVIDRYLPFHFHELDEPVFASASSSPDSLDVRYPFPVATPERALMDWLALRRRGGPTWVPIPTLKMRLELMDSGRLERLASEMGLVDDFREWRARHLNVMRRRKGRSSVPSAPLVIDLPEASDGALPVDWDNNAWPQ